MKTVAPRRDLGISISGILARLIDDMYTSFPSVLLVLVFWPFACFAMISAQIARVFTVGSIRSNVSHAVSNDPRIMNPVLSLSALELSRRIKLPVDHRDKLTSVQVVELFINQMRSLNLYILAVVATRFELALKEAAAADEAVLNNKVPDDAIFWGVPIVVKECFEIPGMPFTGGLVGRMSKVGHTISPAVDQAQRSGAIVLASTNISEACMWHESINNVYGTTNNPYDFGRTAGGSSGGIGASVSACMAPFGISSDVGGSTRIPALYNGLFGHKPTGGAISNANTYPSCGTGT